MADERASDRTTVRATAPLRISFVGGGTDFPHYYGRHGGAVLSATIDILRAVAEGRGPTRWVAALGYAGWGPGQLEQELARHGWFATPGDEKLLYDCDVDTRWAAAFQAAGIDSRLLTAEYGTA